MADSYQQSYGVLFLDDEPLVLNLFKENFSDRFRVFTCATVEDAFALVAREEIALILADQRMPTMSGTEFFAEIQKTHPEIVRILVTGYIDFHVMIAAINAGHVYHYVEKPWDDEEMDLMIRRALEHYHLVRERDRLQAERIETLEKMARSNRLEAVGTLAAGIAHEIRNPLSAVITFHQMLPEKLQEIARDPQAIHTDFWTRFSKMSLREVERIKRLIQELLDFSRDSGTRYQLRRINLADLFEQFLPIFAAEISASGLTLVERLEPDLPEVWVDADKVKQVVINLLLNAKQATPAGGTITLRAGYSDRSRDFFQITVEDTGAGIDPQDRERVFDPFFTTRDPGAGTGLGLTMCHQIVTNHGGEIALESEKNRGTKVMVTLPIQERQSRPSKAERSVSSLSVGQDVHDL